MMLIQKRRGRLRAQEGTLQFRHSCLNEDVTLVTYLLVFQMCMVSESEMPCCPACSSSRSKKYLTASGTGRLVLRITVNRSSTNFCSVPWKTRSSHHPRARFKNKFI